MEIRQDYIDGASVDTVYFGGGTPSLLEQAELQRILEQLQISFSLAPGAEITLEANPDDMTPERLSAWHSAGVNRLSIGIQSFFEEDLQWMNRAHDAVQAMECIRMAQGEGFENMSIDLIYGGPTLPDSHWKKNVERAVDLQVPHLSCYALTVEPRTALDKLIHQHKKEAVNPDDQARQLLLLMDWMAGAGYEHYEISNFAKPGRRSRHNSSYWQGKTYLGLGPSAHSYNGVSRQWNVANNSLYITALNEGTVPSDAVAAAGDSKTALIEKEELTLVQQLNEYIMISLRTMEGSDLQFVAGRWGQQTALQLERAVDRYIREGKVRLHEGRLTLTREGKLLADGIAADLFFE